MPNKDRVEGSIKNKKGELKEGVGKMTGDSKMKSEGKKGQAAGTIQNTVGGIKDKLSGR